MEIFASDGKLVEEEVWQKVVSSIESEIGTGQEITKMDEAVSILGPLIVRAVKKRIPKGKFAIMFSGGVDSSLIAFLCKQVNADFCCYTVGFENSKDILAAKKAAELIGVELVHKTFSLDEFGEILDSVIPILKTKDVVSAGVGAVEYATISLSKEKIFMGGLGSEEIFAGYQRHELALDINNECINGLKGMRHRDFVRDFAITEHFGVNFLAPFMDRELIVAALNISGNLKISGSEKKLCLRETAKFLGLHPEIAFRKKIAAQYGSGFDRAMGLLAKRRGLASKSKLLA